MLSKQPAARYDYSNGSLGWGEGLAVVALSCARWKWRPRSAMVCTDGITTEQMVGIQWVWVWRVGFRSLPFTLIHSSLPPHLHCTPRSIINNR